jgi:diguanylate cyclase (GGDEF)-like protein/PAS domain S-box-containing protein
VGDRTGRWLPGLTALAAVGLAAFLNLLAPLDKAVLDAGTGWLERRVDSDVLVITIDARSLRALNRWPWSREVHARLIERLDAAQPRAVFVDVDFSVGSGDPAADAALARALQAPRDYPLILPAFWQNAGAPGAAGRVLTQPLPAFAENTHTGLVNIFPGAGGLVRDIVHRDRFGNRDYHSTGALLAGRTDLPLATALPIDFTISPGSFAYASYVDVLEGAVPAAAVRGKTVLVGASAVELGDNVPVPLHHTLPGVVLQALSYETLRQGVPVTVPWWVTALGLALWLAVWMLRLERGWRLQLVLCGAGVVTLLGLALLLQGRFGVLLPVGAPLVMIVISLLTGLVATADRQAVLALLARVRLVRQQALISGVLRASIDGILVVDSDGRIRDANPASAALFGIDRQALVGRSLASFLPALARSGGLTPGRRELRLTRGDGGCPVELSISPVEDAGGQLTVIVRDVTERQRQQALLRHQAAHDPLTGLPNRTLLGRMLERLPKQGAAALFMLDLDGFKQVNDTLGHRAGDEVLRHLGRRLRESLPRDVRVFRIGGDEFAVLINGHQRRERLSALARSIVERVRAPVDCGDNQLELGASIGIALFPTHASDGGGLLQCADVAMYTAKGQRTGVEFYDPAQDHSTVRNLTMTRALRGALAAGSLTLAYQPKIRLNDGVCTGVEALVRWTDPELGVVSPGEFVPLAETCDLIEPLTRFTLERALRDHARWCARGMDLELAVNLSARHLAQPAFADLVLALVDRHGIRPDQLEFEITETALMDDPDRAVRMLSKLTGRGIRLAMDDFGTGFSSLSYLKLLNLHALKIDRCFVQDLTRSASDRAIVAATISMAHGLSLQVVAEGIEEDEQLEALAQMGCDLGQGYGIARPMSADDFVAWQQARPRSGGVVRRLRA